MRAQAVAFGSDRLRLDGELVRPDDARTALILCHGIPSGGPPDPDDAGYAGLARDLAAWGHAAFWFSFRGCKGAPGDFSLAGWCDDLEEAIDAVRAHTGELPLVLVGSSMGGMTAIAVAARRPDVAGVATLAAPASMAFGDLLADPLDFLHDARNRGIVRDPSFPPDPRAWADEFGDLAADRHVASVAPRPLLIVHGDADPTVPYPHAERLFAAAGEPKELVRLEAGGHQLRRDPRAIEVLADWLERRFGTGTSASSWAHDHAR